MISSEPTPATTALSVAPAWLVKSIESLSLSLGAGFAVSFEDGVVIDPTLPDAKLIAAAKTVNSAKEKMDQVRVFYDRMLGLLICEYAARHSKSFAESVEEMGLVEKMGLQFRSFERLPRMVEKILPESFKLIGLTTSHYDAAAAFAEPKEPDKKREWRERSHAILEEAAADPKEKTSRWVKDKMRELQKEFGVTPTKKLPASQVLAKHATLSKMLIDWTEADFTLHGLKRSKFLDAWISVDADLVERDLVPDGSDPAAFISMVAGGGAETMEAEELPTEEPPCPAPILSAE